MQTDPEISIIIPVYNVEMWIRRAVESLQNQTFQNFEIILVNDGSTDSSGDICDELAAADGRIHVIHQQAPPLPATTVSSKHAANTSTLWMVMTGAKMACSMKCIAWPPNIS